MKNFGYVDLGLVLVLILVLGVSIKWFCIMFSNVVRCFFLSSDGVLLFIYMVCIVGVFSLVVVSLSFVCSVSS